MATLVKRPLGLMVVVVLVIVQGLLALLRANQWFQVGVDLLGEGLLLIPLMGVVAIGRGGLVAGIGLLYVLFAVGALAAKNWAWWMGLIAALMNVFLVLSLVLQGAPVAQSLVWVIVPAILLYYLFKHSASLTEVSQPKVSLN
jgi:hypothetical protein